MNIINAKQKIKVMINNTQNFKAEYVQNMKKVIDTYNVYYGLITGFTINDGGSGYSVADQITIAGDGSEAEVVVSSISDSPISALKVNTVGHGYRLNIFIFNNLV
jgi:hypothetical protein